MKNFKSFIIENKEFLYGNKLLYQANLLQTIRKTFRQLRTF